MARMLIYVNIIVILTILFALIGFIDSSSSDNTAVFSEFGIGLNNETGLTWSVSDSSFFRNFDAGSGIGLAAAAAILGIVVTFFAKSPAENYVVLGMLIAIFATFVLTFVSIFDYFQNQALWLQVAMGVVMIPIGIGYLFTMIEEFRGNT